MVTERRGGSSGTSRALISMKGSRALSGVDRDMERRSKIIRTDLAIRRRMPTKVCLWATFRIGGQLMSPSGKRMHRGGVVCRDMIWVI